MVKKREQINNTDMFQKIQKLYDNHPIIFIGILIYSLLIIILVITEGTNVYLGDYFVFWQAGKNFTDSSSLYYSKEGMLPYIYPPFAAMIFQIVAVLPFKFSANAFFIINCILYPFCILLIYKIALNSGYSKNEIKIPLLFAVLFSLRYFKINLFILQINEILFLIVLIGIFFCTSNRPQIGVIFFVLATNIKILPLFFIIYTLMLNCNRKVIISIFLSSILCLSLPLLFRGIDKGVNDYISYYDVFLESFQKGKVDDNYLNQNIAGSIHRILLPSVNEEKLNYQLFDVSEKTTDTIINISYIILLSILLTNFVFCKIRKREMSIYDFASLFLFSHLISILTWKAHLVTFLFILFPFFLYNLKEQSFVLKMIYYFLFALIVFLGLSFTKIVGDKLHHYIGGYNLFVLLLLALFFLYEYVLIIKPRMIKNSLSSKD